MGHCSRLSSSSGPLTFRQAAIADQDLAGLAVGTYVQGVMLPNPGTQAERFPLVGAATDTHTVVVVVASVAEGTDIAIPERSKNIPSGAHQLNRIRTVLQWSDVEPVVALVLRL